MEIDGLDFLNTPPMKTVRFGGGVAETLAKHKKVSGDVISEPQLNDIRPFQLLLLSFKGRLE